MHILITVNSCWNLINFRKSLIESLIADGHCVTALAPVDAHTDTVRALVCRFIPLEMNNKGTSLVEEARLLWRIGQVLWKARPDVILSFTIKNNLYAALAARLLGIPILPNVTGLGTVFQENTIVTRLVRLLYRAAFAKAPTVFFQNEEDRALFVTSGFVDAHRTELLPGSGVDLGKFSSGPKPDGNEGPIFLLIARMLWEKGVGDFVEAAQRVRAVHPQARFQLLGFLDVENPSAIDRETMDRWVAEGAIEYIGTTLDVRPFIAAADCIVLPSYYREGTPRTLLEAAAMGRPIITTDMPGCRNTVDDGITGFLIRPRDPNDLTAKLMAMTALDAAARSEMGVRGRQKAERAFDERIVIDAYRSQLVRSSCKPGRKGPAGED